ncbi:MAG: HAD family phosphatase [Lentisphaerales bacterium]|nr:HAD family phosphatase [Lentisphaerales bacterium]
MKHNFKLFIFDMDGTLVDTEGLYVQSLIAACLDRDFELEQEAANMMIYGKAWSSIYADMELLNPGLFKSEDDVKLSSSVHFDNLLKDRDPAIKPSVKLLKELATENKVCIVSGSSREHIAHFIDLLDIADDVDFYIGSEDYSQGKPDPQCFLQAAAKVGVHPEECLVFEDSNAGVTAAKNAGMYCVGFKCKENPQDISHTDLLLSCLSQFSFARITS